MANSRRGKRVMMEEIRHDIEGVSGALARARRKQEAFSVVGVGSLNARVVFIGEAPGKREALCGKPFVGMAGRVLDELLKEAGLSRKSVYLTNLVNDRPPENRDPTQKEIKKYSSFQRRQIAIIRPRVIATLGRHAMAFACDLLAVPSCPIGGAHGKPLYGFLPYGDVVLLPLYHPAAALYNRSLFPAMKKDMRILRRLVS